MAGWGICIGFIGGLALVGIALAASRKAARSIDVTFGGVPYLPEGLAARHDFVPGGEAGHRQPSHRVAHTTDHGSHPHDRGASSR